MYYFLKMSDFIPFFFIHINVVNQSRDKPPQISIPFFKTIPKENKIKRSEMTRHEMYLKKSIRGRSG